MPVHSKGSTPADFSVCELPCFLLMQNIYYADSILILIYNCILILMGSDTA